MSASFGKREREKKQQERAAAKRQRRAEREPSVQADTTELMERFRVLSEAFAAGTVERAAYEAQRHEIMSALGVAEAVDI